MKVVSFIKSRSKSFICIGMAVITLISSIMISVNYSRAKSGSYDVLGTNNALGSPILNENFKIEDWNKWEMICWGVFLSNFCKPLIDNYNTAFMPNSTEGSKGAGFKALAFGSGNDSANNETIQELCEYAVAQQQSVAYDTLYVAYTPFTGTTLGEKPDPAKEPERIAPATINDLMLVTKAADDLALKEFNDRKESDPTYNFLKTIKGDSVSEAHKFFTIEKEVLGIKGEQAVSYGNIDNYEDIRIMPDILPTFYIYNGESYEVIWDLTDSWDLQMMTCMLNDMKREGTYDAFKDKLNTLLDSEAKLKLDPFANIVVDNNIIVIPSASNKHITDDERINLLNSFIFNNYITSVSNDELVLNSRQMTESVKLFGIWNTDAEAHSGVPALGESNIKVGLMYYDLDSCVSSQLMGTGDKNLHYGNAVRQLFDADIRNESSNGIPLKIEVGGDWLDSNYRKNVEGEEKDTVFERLCILANTASNFLPSEKTNFLTEIVTQDGSKQSIFSDKAVVTNVMVLNSKVADEPTEAGKVRQFLNFMYQAYDNSVNTTEGKVDKTDIDNILTVGQTVEQFGDEAKDKLESKFNSYNTLYKNTKLRINDGRLDLDYGDNEGVAKKSSRLIKAYPVSEVMRSISKVLGLSEGTEYQAYSTMIYMTYLDWYGIDNSNSIQGTNTKVSNFNTRIFLDKFDVLNVDPSSLIEVKSKDELETELMQMSYLMLHPEKGREYRKEMMFNGMSDWIYNTYTRLVYGTSEVTSGEVSKSNSGFLNIETYKENFFTSMFISNYTEIAVWLILITVLIIVLMGILRNKKISWFVISFFVVINTLLILPSSGELVPYTISSRVQKMFSDKMTFWSLSQGVSNARVENDSINNQKSTVSMGGMTEEESKIMLQLVNKISSLQADSSLCIKQDVSQKILQKTGGIYNDIQSLQSARWVLTAVMEQFTGDNNSEEYVYKPLNNIWTDMSNNYWYFNQQDAVTTDSIKSTATSGQNGDNVPTAKNDGVTYYNISKYYPDLNTEIQTKAAKSHKNKDGKVINYGNYSYTLKASNDEIYHLVVPYLQNGNTVTPSRASSIGKNFGKYKGSKSWKSYIKKNLKTSGEAWRTNGSEDDKSKLENVAGSYDRLDRTTYNKIYSYLLSTESPLYYMYAVVKDSFDSDTSLGALIGQLQGQVETVDEVNEKGEISSKDIRNNFMYATTGGTGEEEGYTGYCRDILDLQELFGNVVPYLYQTQLLTGGYDNKSGILGEAKITNKFSTYEGEYQAWMYRCNWATKIMENPEFSKPTTVTDSDGNTIKIKNPLCASSYPSNRPMICSEAQMYAYDLKESDLNLVELKCIKVNKEVAKKWTLLINYAGMSELTKEVLMRQMATDAVLVLNEEFSTSGLITYKYYLYPQSIDLRYLSFDSIMKMLMLNVSKSTNYVYGNTMATLINDTDIFTSMLLLISAFISIIIPIIRQFIMALIFYLGLANLIKSLVGSTNTKVRMASGQIISNVLFGLYTILYYEGYRILMAVTSSDEVLSVGYKQVSSGNPIWVLLIVLILNLAYIGVMLMHTKLLIVNYRDMGLEVISCVASTVVGKLRDIKTAIGHGIGNMINGTSGEGGSAKGSSRNNVDENTGNTENNTQNNIQNNSNTSNNGGNAQINNDSSSSTTVNNSNNKYEISEDDRDEYINIDNSESNIRDKTENKALEINQQIEEGERIEQREHNEQSRTGEDDYEGMEIEEDLEDEQ